MQLSDPLPVEDLARSFEEIILPEVHGRHTTGLEIANVADPHWSDLPTIGPARLARLRSLAEGIYGQLQPSALIGMIVEELLAQSQKLVTGA
jgi:hypothetical protein